MSVFSQGLEKEVATLELTVAGMCMNMHVFLDLSSGNMRTTDFTVFFPAMSMDFCYLVPLKSQKTMEKSIG